MTQTNYEKITVIKAIKNNKGIKSLPEAIARYNAMTDEERNQEVRDFISYGGKI